MANLAMSGLKNLDARNLQSEKFTEWKTNPATKDAKLASDIAKASQNLADSLMKDKNQQIKDNLSQENDKKQLNIGKSLLNGVSSIGRGIGNFAISTGIWKDFNPDKGLFGEDNDGNKTFDLGQAVGNGVGNIGRGLGFASQFLPQQEMAENANNKAAQGVATTVGTAALQSGNPWAALYGGALLAGQKLGINNSGSDTGNKAVDFGNSALALIPGLGLLGKKAGKYNEDALVNSSYSYNNIGDQARKNSNGRFLINGSGIKSQIEDANLKTYIASNDILKPGKLDIIGAQDPKYYIAAQNELNGGYNQVGRAKQGTILQFTKRIVSKRKIKKQQNGGSVDIDAQYLKQIKDKNFLQDWDPDKESFRDYVDKRQTRDEYDQLTDGNIYNNLYYYDITQDDYDMGKDQFLFFYDGSPYSFTDLGDARKAYNQMTPQEKRQFYINGIERSIRAGQFFQEGGQIKHKQTARTLDELVDYVEQKNPPFWERMSGQDKNGIPSPFGDRGYSTLLMGWSTGDNGMAEVYPSVQYDNTTHHLKYIQDWHEALDLARKNGDIVIMTPEEAENFTTNYKKASKLKHIYDSILPQYTETFTGIFKEGGKVNVIPEGALHKNKHHLEEVDEKFEDVTTKGIPVIVESEDGEVIQQAEVEREEIIFRLEVTKKLEELSKKHTDEAAIEAGKLLVKEILYNTEDNTGKMI